MNLSVADPRIPRFQGGDETVLGELYDEHADHVFSLALRILGDRSEAEDVLQETWIQAWAKRSEYRPEQASFAGWITMLARSRALDRVRRRSARVKKEAEVGLEEPTRSSPPLAEWGLLADKLRAEVASLEPQQRTALELAYWGGLSHSKISEEMGQPLGTVKTWVRSGILRLRDRVVKERTS
ncbi:MAG: sigma-70 family RNA polymerase sigma factor [Candidatus Eisenbacteria bacterium]|uniref:Sigma-70 family RNA polymerase sigma factor n=1 Tax=Eiseniibacteriota bacterium TaxID=2212470 RepID=A0A956NJ07_UNCEI|nr:sigma-70 family RNA polymerase sigma factor [Candidatus Eisenbacteria bacterium]MCB9465921.1 sigma-70 family RNA polymerase sigma factor [Candidatus Eisenbacteria bacterium]